MMSDSLLNKPTSNQVKKFGWLKTSIIVIFIVICCGLISSVPAIGMWDGAFPAGEYHLRIENEEGNPIKGASLSVFKGRTKNLTFEYPIDNYYSDGGLISDEQGIIVALHEPRGFEFGGPCWNAFWVYPICSSSPEYRGQISAEGYKTIRFSLDKLFDLAYNSDGIGTTPVLLEDGRTVEIPIFEMTFTLKK